MPRIASETVEVILMCPNPLTSSRYSHCSCSMFEGGLPRPRSGLLKARWPYPPARRYPTTRPRWVLPPLRCFVSEQKTSEADCRSKSTRLERRSFQIEMSTVPCMTAPAAEWIVSATPGPGVELSVTRPTPPRPIRPLDERSRHGLILSSADTLQLSRRILPTRQLPRVR